MAEDRQRLRPLPLESFREVERSRGLPAAEPALNVLRTIARNPILYEGWLRFGGALFQSGLEARQRELIVLRTAWRVHASYEWAQHVGMARAAGLSELEIRRVAHGPDAEWAETDLLLLTAVDELVAERCLKEATWAALADRFSPAELLLIPMLSGHYVMLAGVLGSAGVTTESADLPLLGEV